MFNVVIKAHFKAAYTKCLLFAYSTWNELNDKTEVDLINILVCYLSYQRVNRYVRPLV